MSDLKKRFRTYSENNLEFEEAQVIITNELSKELVGLEKSIGKFETKEEQDKILAKRKRDIMSLISILDDSVARAINIIKGALNEEVATIIEFPKKI